MTLSQSYEHFVISKKQLLPTRRAARYVTVHYIKYASEVINLTLRKGDNSLRNDYMEGSGSATIK